MRRRLKPQVFRRVRRARERPDAAQLRKPTPGARRRAQAARRMRRRAINGDALGGQLSAAGRSRRHVRPEVIGRATATMIVASVVMAVASVPGATARGPVHRAKQPMSTRHRSYILVDPGTLGGPVNGLDLPGIPVTDGGVLIGSADT